MSRYANDMHSIPNRQSSMDERRRGSGHYGQKYETPDQIGAQHSPTRNIARAIEVPISQSGQNQQRMVPVVSRPPVANAVISARGTGGAGSRPPSYTGPPVEERSDAANQRQEKRRGYRRTEDPSDDWEQPGSNPQSNSRPAAIQTASYGASSIPNQALPAPRDRVNPAPVQARQEAQAQKPISPIKQKAQDALMAAGAIPRINSPSVMESVLQPLDKKVQEYDLQMNQAQNQMAQLDAEMAALQERRKEAERRYGAAKGKHDEYQKQYQGVERAMRGEPEAFSRSSFDDAESLRPSTQQTLQQPVQDRRPLSPRTESWSSMKKSKNDSRSRLSKFFSSS